MHDGFILQDGYACGGVTARTFPGHRLGTPTQTAPVGCPEDAHWMREALLCAMSANGRTSPNPAVGCVIVKDGQLIGHGATERYGGRHAERVAIDSVRSREALRGATLYTTLEPCAHYGRQPPCSDLVASCGLRRCVIGIIDPNPLVARKGSAQVAAAGVEVTFGVLASEVVAWHLPFLLAQLAARPLLGAVLWARELAGEEPGLAPSLAYRDWLYQKYDAVLLDGSRVARGMREVGGLDRCAPPHHRRPARIVLDTACELLRVDEETWQQSVQPVLRPDPSLVVLISDSGGAAGGSPRLEGIRASGGHVVALPPGDMGPDTVRVAVAQALAALGNPPAIQSVLVDREDRVQPFPSDIEGVDLVHVFGASPDDVAARREGLLGTALGQVCRTSLGPRVLEEYLHARTRALLDWERWGQATGVRRMDAGGRG